MGFRGDSIRSKPGLGWARGLLAAGMACLGFLLSAAPAGAQPWKAPVETGPSVPIEAPSIVDKRNTNLPLDLEFTTSDGKAVKLRDLFHRNKPVIITMVYFSCPSLCGHSQDALVRTLQAGPRGLSLGKDYDVLIVSIDPDDLPATAAAKRSKYVGFLGRPESEPGLIYLTGREPAIRELADKLGFRYKQNYGDAVTLGGKYAHGSGIFVCSPYGRLSETITGLNYGTDVVHHSLVVAGEGKVGAGLLGVGLSCGAIHFDPTTGTYVHNPWFGFGSAVGAATFAFMAIFLGGLWLGEWKKTRGNKAPGGATPALH